VTHGFVKEGETYTIIDVPGAEGTYPLNINNSGATVGEFINSSGGVEGFVRTSHGRVTVVDFPGAPTTAIGTAIGGINDRGEICGWWFNLNTGAGSAFVAFNK